MSRIRQAIGTQQMFQNLGFVDASSKKLFPLLRCSLLEAPSERSTTVKVVIWDQIGCLLKRFHLREKIFSKEKSILFQVLYIRFLCAMGEFHGNQILGTVIGMLEEPFA